ncbi:MAG: hypothetical protein JXA20_15295 [Spirochaetes bacterium]|nr:hypothetical protein [Spirochaetota bacterium]
MKKETAIGILLGFVLILPSCDPCSCDKIGTRKITPAGDPYPREVSASVRHFLGSDILNILKNAHRVQSYRIDYHKSTKTEGTLGGYPVIAAGEELVPKQVEILRSVFLDERTYCFDVIKKCLFLPEYAFRLMWGDEECLLLVSYSCKEVTFIHGGRERLEDFDSAVPVVRLLTHSLFGKQ